MRSLGIAAVAVQVLWGLAGCAAQQEEARKEPVQAARLRPDQLYIYRGVDQSNPGTGRASLAPSQFNFNPELSTFDNPGMAPVLKPCNYRFTVSNVAHQPPQPGDTGAVDGLPGYTATFDNNPPGHWGIQHPAGVTPAQAKTAVSQYAQDNRDNVINGTAVNCN
ncbi:MAG TPA: hypothetical protein VF815_05505 [Myxococcaceae bacterium]|jgi:hypothetical protein